MAPCSSARTAAAITAGGPSWSGNPCPRLTEPVRTASADISVKIVGAMPWSRVARGSRLVTLLSARPAVDDGCLATAARARAGPSCWMAIVTADPTLAADIDAACRLSGTFTLRSGQVSHEYFDKYLFETSPALLARVAEAMVELVPEDTELLGGLEMGGIPIATVLSSRTGLPALFVRKKAKEYGTCKLAEGPDVAGRRITLVEDVITTGGAVRDATKALREAGRDRRGRGLRDRPQPRGRQPARRRRARGPPGAHQGRPRRRARRRRGTAGRLGRLAARPASRHVTDSAGPEKRGTSRSPPTGSPRASRCATCRTSTRATR